RKQAVVRPLPRRPDPEATDARGLVERAPAVLPAVGDVDRGRTAEDMPETLLALRVGVCGKLDAFGALDFLEAFREELEHRGARLLRAHRRDLNRDSAQAAQPAARNAFFSLSKKL